MPTTRKSNNRPLQGSAAKTALAAALAVVAITPGRAQVADDNKAQLRQAGFTTKDFDAAATTQVSPHYALYKKWRDCFREATNASLVTGRSADDSLAFAKTGCQEELLDLRASIAKPLGLAEANRVITLLFNDGEISIRRAWQRQNGDLPPGTRMVGSWRITPGSDGGSCGASSMFGGINQPVRLYKNQSGFYLLVRTERPQPAVGSLTSDRVIIGHQPSPTQIDARFEVVSLEGQIWLAAKLLDDDVGFLRISGAIIIKDRSTVSVWSEGGDENISLVPDFRDAVAAVLRC